MKDARSKGSQAAGLQLQLPLFDSIDPAAPADWPGIEGSPGADRLILLEGQPVRWQLVRARRRSIGFQIDHRGLRVSAPRWVSLREITGALEARSGWILAKLVEWRRHTEREAAYATRWQDGGEVRLLGEPLRLCIDPLARGIEHCGDLLRIDTPPGADAEQIRQRVEAWLREQARTVFGQRLPIYAERLGRGPARWGLSSARTRWGSCSRDGSIRLNWRLIHFPLELIDYVIAHELAHLAELNHGPRFWSTVGSLFPEFESARRRLRSQALAGAPA
jgi:predicted metal-dependent hydrolase